MQKGSKIKRERGEERNQETRRDKLGDVSRNCSVLKVRT